MTKPNSGKRWLQTAAAVILSLVFLLYVYAALTNAEYPFDSPVGLIGSIAFFPVALTMYLHNKQLLVFGTVFLLAGNITFAFIKHSLNIWVVMQIVACIVFMAAAFCKGAKQTEILALIAGTLYTLTGCGIDALSIGSFGFLTGIALFLYGASFMGIKDEKKEDIQITLSDEMVDGIIKLKRLLDNGSISQEEYDSKKEEIIGQKSKTDQKD